MTKLSRVVPRMVSHVETHKVAPLRTDQSCLPSNVCRAVMKQFTPRSLIYVDGTLLIIGHVKHLIYWIMPCLFTVNTTPVPSFCMVLLRLFAPLMSFPSKRSTWENNRGRKVERQIMGVGKYTYASVIVRQWPYGKDDF